MAITIAFSNHKGGVGKTTSTINIGTALQKQGFRVLLVDFDPQANLSVSLGVKNPTESIYDAISKKIPALPIVTNAEGLHIVPSHVDLSGAEMETVQVPGRDNLLKRHLKPFSDTFDFILIDCPPTLSFFTVNALTAANGVIIPVEAGYLAVQGLAKFLQMIELVQEGSNENLKIFGILITKYDSRKTLSKEIAESVAENFPTEIFSTKIRTNVALDEAQWAGQDIFAYKAKSYGTVDYQNVTMELLKRLNLK